tara:strand:- start:21 stop:203 length:183 start_codon:yes stop_codon:yes gene_type:complete
MIIYLDIKRIIFSSKDNTFISENPKNLKIIHESAGNKFLRKTQDHKQDHKQSQKNKTSKK